MCSALLCLHYSMRVRFVKEQGVSAFLYHDFTGISPLKYLLPQSFVLGGGRPQDGGRSFPQKTEERLRLPLREDRRIIPAVFRAFVCARMRSIQQLLAGYSRSDMANRADN